MKLLNLRRGAVLLVAPAFRCAVALLIFVFCTEISRAHADTKSTLQEFGLAGTYSEDCPALRTEGDSWVRFEIPNVGDATVISRAKETISHLTITRARIIGNDKLVIDGKLTEDGTKYEVVLEKSANRVRIWRAIKDAGESSASTIVDDGKVPGTTISIVWEQQCDQSQEAH